MRIAMVSEHASPLATLGGVDAGGQNTHVAELARAVAARGHEVRVYTRREDRTAPSEVDFAPGVVVEHVPAGPPRVLPKDDLLPFMGDFGRWLEKRWSDGDFRPDVVHAHFWMSGLAALTATAGARVPVVVTFHALGTVKRRYQGAKDTSPEGRVGLERTLGRLADRVIAQCADEVDELARMGIARNNIVVAPSGVDTETFSPAGPTMPRREGLRRVLSVGRLVERKGYDDLIRALRRVPDTELVIAGGPPAEKLDGDPEAQRLRAVAAKAGVGDRLVLLGSVPSADMPAWYRSADVVCCPPWYEPFGLTPLEAMACGVPVVTYAVGGLAESVIDGVTGLHVPPRDVRALAVALRSVLQDEVRRMSFASAAVDRVRSRYTWDRAALDVGRVYASVAGLETDTLTEVPG
ncbi:glycosyltransferase [Virgisporangium aliadipatigenens]|nr:glycosyltransferase [Virgisporangium aliadipatigenens]